MVNVTTPADQLCAHGQLVGHGLFCAGCDGAARIEEPVLEATVPAAEVSEFVQGGDFVLDAPDKVAAIWGDGSAVLWAEGESLMIVGSPGVGKTTLLGQLVRARLGLATDVLGYTVTPGERLLYLAMDRPRQTARSLRRQFTEPEREFLNDALVVRKGPPPFDLSQHPYVLRDLCRRAECDTVVIDSVKDAAVGLSDDSVGAGYNRARQLVIADGVEVAEAHHQVKRGANGGAPDSLPDVYGSTWLTAGAGSVLLLNGSAGDPIVGMKHLKSPADGVGPLVLIHDHERGLTSLHHVADLLALATASGGLTARAAAAALYGSKNPTPSDVERARRKLNKYVEDGRLTTRTYSLDGGGKTLTTWHLVGPEEGR